MTASFRGRLFGPDLPGAGAEAAGRWEEDGRLVVTLADRELTVADPVVAAGGFNAGVLRLSWHDDAGEHAFCIETEGSRAACLAAAPPTLAPRLAAAAGTQRRLERRFRLGWAALALLLLLPALVLGLFLLKADAVAEWVIERIPFEQEARLGDLVLGQTRRQMPLLEEGDAVETVRAIGKALTAESPYRYRWLVAEHAERNAFAAPGGVVVVNAGLIRAADSAEEIAGVLAHEIAHVELRHGLKAMTKGLGLRALAALALGDFSGSVWAQAAQELTTLGYSRETEREADREGVRRLAAAGIDPAGMVRFFEKLTQEPSPPAFLSTHPATAARLADLRQEIASLRGDWRPLAVDLAAAKAALPAP